MFAFGVSVVLRYTNNLQGRMSSYHKRKLSVYATSMLKNLDYPKVNENLKYHFNYISIIYLSI